MVSCVVEMLAVWLELPAM